MGINPVKLLAGAATSLVSGVLGGLKPPKTPDAPVVEPPPVMPVPDDEAMKKARRRSITQQLSRRGRQSTILSDSSSDALGG